MPVTGYAQTNTSIPQTGDEFVGPFSSWLNVKTGFGAKGDGITDDTPALQTALNAAAKGTPNPTVFLPAGTYRITATLSLDYQINVSVIGADPATTIIKWAGAARGTMLRINGTAYSKFDRLTFNGDHIAGVAVEQSWDGSRPHFDTRNEYADDIFTDVGFGIHGGALGHGFAETTILRDRFIRNSIAGVSLGNFNALDVWIRESQFRDCAIGVTNTTGAGNFKVYQCVFRNSTQHDMAMGNTGDFSIRGNTSVHSADFFYAGNTRNPAPTTIQGNTIVDPINTQAIHIGNQGPVLLLNNTVRSRSTATSGPVAQLGPNSLSSSNTFTVTNPVSVGDNSVSSHDKTVSLSALKNLAVPTFPGTEPNLHRRVYEVPPGANTDIIQSIIDKAGKASGTRPVVHFPGGSYSISATLHIPSGSDIQLVGDGFGDVHVSMLVWNGSGPGPVIQLSGPSRVTIRDLTIKGNPDVTNILITNADQKRSRIFLQEFHQAGGNVGLMANKLDHALIFAYDAQFSGLKTAVLVSGKPGRPAEGRTILYSGAESDNVISHEISGNGNLTVQDTWYEGGTKSTWAKLSGQGMFIASGDHIATPQHTDIPSVSINDFSGSVLFVATDFSDRFSVSGNSHRAKILALGLLSEDDPLMEDGTASKADIRLLMSRGRSYDPKMIYGGSYPLENIGTYDQAFVDSMLAGAISVPALKLTALPTGVCDIRLYRVMSLGGACGLRIESSVK